jgi:WD40 repeat protein
MARIFLSHSSKNDAAAMALRDWIVAGGWDDHPFLDLDPTRGIAAGERWEQALHEAADRCEVVLFLVSEDWLKSEWCRKEFSLAQKLNKRLFGALIEDIPRSRLPESLPANWQLVDLASGADHELFRVDLRQLGREEHVTFSRSGLARLKAGLDKAGLDPRFFAWPPADEPDRPPYPGLRPVEAADAGVFFGREAPIVIALDRLRGLREASPPRLLAILGASGAGKSSFLRAGLLPRLARDDANFLPLPIIRPQTSVIAGSTGLIASVHEAFWKRGLPLNRADIAKKVEAGAAELASILERLAQTAGALDASEDVRLPPPSLVCSIDQGEELFLHDGADEAQTFLSMLKELLLARTPNMIVLFTIRSDSYERLQTAKALEGIRQETLGLPPMPRGAYQMIIEGPALRLEDGKRKLKIEPTLTQALLTDIETGGGKDALPLLAFTLERIYREYGADGDLRLEEYRALGGIGSSIRAAVETALKGAHSDPTIPKDRSERLRLLRRAMIPALANIDPATKEPRRRVARICEIPREARDLVDCLVEARLLVTDRDKETGETTIEPAHESLLRQWQVLRDWLDEDSAALLILEGLRQAAQDWEAKGRSSAWLGHSAGRLEDAESLRSREDFARFLTPVDSAYLEACRAQENERRNRELEAAKTIARRTRIGLVTASVLASIALAAALLAWSARSSALLNEFAALRNESISLATFSRLALDRGQPVDAVRLALAAWPRVGYARRPQTRQTIDALKSALLRLRERMSFSGHRGAVTCAAFSPDGVRIVTASNDKTARIWDANTGAVLMELKGHGENVTSAAFRPDGAQVVTASNDGVAIIRDAETGEPLATLKGHGAGVTSAAFSPDGARIVTASKDKTARTWNAKTGALLATLEGHGDYVTSAAFSPDGASIVTASHDKTARIWNATTGAPLPGVYRHEQFLTFAAFSPDGARIVTASGDGTARVWDVRTAKEVVKPYVHSKAVRSAAFSPDGARIVTASDDNVARIWDAATSAVLATLEGHRDKDVFAGFSPDGARIVTASWDGTARIWDAGRSAVLLKLEGHGGSVVAAAFSPDGGRVVTGSNDNTARIWDAATGSLVITLEVPGDREVSAAFSPDGARIVMTSFDKAARVLDAKTGAILLELEGHGDRVVAAAFSPDGARVVTASWDKTARIWNARTGAALAELEGHDDIVSSAAFSPDGARVVTASWDKTARIWNAETGAVLVKLKGHRSPVVSAAFSPDGARVVTASEDKTARIWDAATGAALVALEGHGGRVASAVFSPDGARVVTASEDKTVRIWDGATGVALAELEGHGGLVASAAFSPDGGRIVTASSDRTARVWDSSTLEKGEAFAVACARLGNNAGLTGVAERYGLAELKPICGTHAPDKVDRRMALD